jgi:hypothetical protein
MHHHLTVDCYNTLIRKDMAADTYSQIRGKETPFSLYYSQANGFMLRRKP